MRPLALPYPAIQSIVNLAPFTPVPLFIEIALVAILDQRTNDQP